MSAGILVLNQPGVYLVDADGNIITLVDGAVLGNAEGVVAMGKDGVNARMLAVDASGRARTNLETWLGSVDPTVGQKAMAASLPVTLASDQPAISVSEGAPSPVDAVRDFCRNGGSRDMNVNGSGTPVEFTFPADAAKDIAVSEIRLVMVAAAVKMDGTIFGKNGSLSNGLKLDATSNESTFELANFVINEDFLAAPGRVSTIYDGPTNDQITASFDFGGSLILKAGTSDNVKVTVRDNLTSGGTHKVNVLWAVVFGREL